MVVTIIYQEADSKEWGGGGRSYSCLDGHVGMAVAKLQMLEILRSTLQIYGPRKWEPGTFIHQPISQRLRVSSNV